MGLFTLFPDVVCCLVSAPFLDGCFALHCRRRLAAADLCLSPTVHGGARAVLLLLPAAAATAAAATLTTIIIVKKAAAVAR